MYAANSMPIERMERVSQTADQGDIVEVLSIPKEVGVAEPE